MSFLKKSARELEAERLALIDEAAELAAVMEGPRPRDMNATEKARFDELTGDNGLVAAKAEEVETQRRVEANRDAQRAAQLGAPSPKFGGVYKDNGASSLPRLKTNRGGVIKDEKLAHLAGCFFQAAGKLPKAEQARADMHRFGWGEYATQTEGVGTAGGYLVPTPIIDEIIKHRDEVGVAMQTGRIYPMTSDTLQLPGEAGRPTVYYPGEAGEITASDATLEGHTLSVRKRGVLVRASSEVLADSVAAFGDYIVESSGYAMAEKMDLEYLLGDGTSTYGGEEGLIPTIGTAGVQDADTGEDTLAELDVEDWTKTVGRLPGKYHRGAAWIMSREVWNGSVLPLMANSGGAGFAALMAGASAGSPGSLQWLGYPVYFSDLMPAAAASTVVALFGDFRRAVSIGDRQDMRIDSSIHEQFDKDLVSFRVLHRYDILVTHPGDSSDAGAYVALKTAA